MLDTDYAKELVPPAVLTYEGENEVRLERLLIKETGVVEIRLSWWKDGKMMPRPVDIPEADFWRLVAKGVRQGVLVAE